MDRELAPRDAEVKIPLVTLCILMVNALQGFASKDVGFEDTEQTLEEFLKEMEKRSGVHLAIKDLEQLLWAANLRAESGYFWHPGRAENLESFLQKLFRFVRLDRTPLQFDRDYNVITYKPGSLAEDDGE